MRIVHYPHPALRHPARAVALVDKTLHLQVGKMFDLMYEAVGLGLAAPQVALPYRLLVMNMSGDARQQQQERVYINPTIVARSGLVRDDEGCLSFPGLFVKVRRAERVVVQAWNIEGEKVEIFAEGLAARCWQHEIDHLDGVVFIERWSSWSRWTRAGEVRAFERRFRAEQAAGTIPATAELERTLHALASR